MQYTENIDLLKPDQNEQYNIDHANENMDIIDEHIHDLEEGADSLREEMLAGDEDAKQFSNMQGICAVDQGGTGKTTVQDALNNLHSDVQAADTLSDVDEFLFLHRTPEDIQLGTPASLDTKSVLLDELAQKIFALISGNQQGSISYGIFSPTANGFVPKSGSAGATKFLNALGDWEEPQGKIDVYDVTASASFDVGLSTVIRIKSNATVLVRDPSVFGASLVITNETARYQLVSIKLREGSVSYKLNKGKIWRLFWAGSFWVPQSDEPDVGSIMMTYETEAPYGWFMCDGTDTEGTANELETCYPYLYDICGGNVLPDWRECAPVGAGRNTLDSMSAHDTFEVGQFKDSMISNHTHNRGTMNISGRIMDVFGPSGSPQCRGDGAFSVALAGQRADITQYGGVGVMPGGIGSNANMYAYYATLNASGNWSGETSNPLNCQAGSFTRGKRKGINFIIKA